MHGAMILQIVSVTIQSNDLTPHARNCSVVTKRALFRVTYTASLSNVDENDDNVCKLSLISCISHRSISPDSQVHKTRENTEFACSPIRLILRCSKRWSANCIGAEWKDHSGNRQQ